jgi:hypothetical protein
MRITDRLRSLKVSLQTAGFSIFFITTSGLDCYLPQESKTPVQQRGLEFKMYPAIFQMLSKIVIAFCMRWRTFSRPMISMLSKSGGLTFCPVTATRIRPKT